MMKAFASIVLFLVLDGCASPDCQGQYTFDGQTVSSIEREAIAKTEINFNHWIGVGTVNFTEVSGNPGYCHVNFNVAVIKDNPHYAGMTYRETRNIDMAARPSWNSQQISRALSHEIGHSLGMKHVAGNGHLMSVVIPRDSITHWTREDLDECISVGACNENTNTDYLDENQ